MRKTCDEGYWKGMFKKPDEAPCFRRFDDAEQSTQCPHDPLPPPNLMGSAEKSREEYFASNDTERFGKSIVMSIVGCASCNGEGHEDLHFEKLQMLRQFDTVDKGLMVFAYWAPCPTNGQPIWFGVSGITPPDQIKDPMVKEIK